MLRIRAGIPRNCFHYLSLAVTIGTRYSLVRKQFKSETGTEIQILDYQLQQEKIIPHIAECYANFFGAKKIY
jgi:acyl-CoA oxidase